MREDWVDRWKGLLICLVVLGHAVGMGCHFAQGLTKESLVYMYKAIYCFHMAAFFCAVGYVWRTRADESLMEFFRKKISRLIVPYLAFAVLSGVIYYLASGASGAAVHHATDAYYAKRTELPTIGGLLLSIVHAGGWPDNGVIRGNSVLWFLPAMFSVCILYRCLDRGIPNAKGQLALTPLFLIVSAYVPFRLPWGLSFSAYYLSYVIVGRWILPKIMDCRWLRFLPVFLLGVAYLAACWLMPNAICQRSNPYWKVCFFLLGALGCWVSALVSKKCDFRFLSNLGLSSLGIMLTHKYIILAVGMKLPFVRSLYASSLLVAMLSIGMLTLLALLVSCGLSKIIERYVPELLGGCRK